MATRILLSGRLNTSLCQIEYCSPIWKFLNKFRTPQTALKISLSATINGNNYSHTGQILLPPYAAKTPQYSRFCRHKSNA
jgi:hypothetical protein